MGLGYLDFKIDSVEEAKNIPKLVRLAGKEILIPYLSKKYSNLSKKELSSEVVKLHIDNKKKFMKIKSIYEKIWKKIGKDYFRNIEKILGHISKEKKTCYIAPSLWINIADVLGKRNIFIVAAEVQQNPLDFLLLHELTHLYYAEIVDRLKLPEAGRSPLMEGIDHLILFKSPMNKLFSSKKYGDVEFIKQNPEFMGKLEKQWRIRNNFKSFLREAIKIQDKFPNVVIC
jgi:hypothetical protein